MAKFSEKVELALLVWKSRMCHLLVFKTRYGLGLMLDDNTMKNIVCSHRSIKSCFDPSKHFYETTEIKLYIFAKFMHIISLQSV